MQYKASIQKGRYGFLGKIIARCPVDEWTITVEVDDDFDGEGHYIECGKCQLAISLDQRDKLARGVYGVEWPDAHCDAACINAIGQICICSCGGANHGIRWIPTDMVPIVTRDFLQRTHGQVVLAHMVGTAKV